LGFGVAIPSALYTPVATPAPMAKSMNGLGRESVSARATTLAHETASATTLLAPNRDENTAPIQFLKQQGSKRGLRPEPRASNYQLETVPCRATPSGTLADC
jgi:hypothetical protein